MKSKKAMIRFITAVVFSTCLFESCNPAKPVCSRNPQDIIAFLILEPSTSGNSSEKNYVLLGSMKDNNDIPVPGVSITINGGKMNVANYGNGNFSCYSTLVFKEGDSVCVSIESEITGILTVNGYIPKSVDTFYCSPSFPTNEINTNSDYSVSWAYNPEISNYLFNYGVTDSMGTPIGGPTFIPIDDDTTKEISFSSWNYKYITMSLVAFKEFAIHGCDSSSKVLIAGTSILAKSNVKRGY